MLETEENVVTFLRIVGFLFLLAGVYPSIIFTPTFITLSILTTTDIFLYLRILSIFYVISVLGCFLVASARYLKKQVSN